MKVYMTVIGASHLSLHYAEIEIFSDVTLQVNERARIGIVGPNGSGKTSLIRVLLGEQDYDKGEIFFPEHVRIGYVPQTAMDSGKGTIKDQIMSGFSELIKLEMELTKSALQIEQTEGSERKRSEQRYSTLLDKYESMGGYDYQNRMERVVQGVGLSEEVLNTPLEDASGGERTRAALASALLGEPDLLILDEPTNYLDFKGLEWLEDFLSHFSSAFIVVSHDRYFLDRVVKEIWEIDDCKLKSYPGNFSKYRLLKEEEIIRQEKEYQKQRDHIRREEYFIARYHAGQRSKEARGRARKLSRIERLEAPTYDEKVHISSVSASRTGQTVIKTMDLSVGYVHEGQIVNLFNVPDYEIQKETTTAIIGSNGIGKTTLLKTILGEIPPIKGSVSLGHNVKTGYFRQGSDEIPEDLTVMEALLQIKNLSIGEARSFLARFLFKGEEIFEQVKSLSGGERGRLALARLLITEPNVLILDEPTTHLDIPSREALETMLQDFDGSVIFVSHDRHLISLLANNLWFVDDGQIHEFEGTYDDWLESNRKNTFSNQKIDQKIELPVKKSSKKKAPQNKKSKSVKPPSIDISESIEALENEIKQIEQKLDEASNSGDLDLIIDLGEKHAILTSKMEKALSSWVN
ncbi:MAG TPA: ABC transporter ATP-binding protein [Dehalococcoidia bacterium]|nr:ABC transporter ATP-binding protein [Dehalococcoidia bacterium]